MSEESLAELVTRLRQLEANRTPGEWVAIVVELSAKNERLKTYLTEMASVRPSYFKDRGCSDGNCVIYKPEGMHTNGGCKCGTKYDTKQWAGLKLRWFKQQAREALEPKK